MAEQEPKAKHPGGRPTKFKPEYVAQAEKLCALGATDEEVLLASIGGEDAYLAMWLNLRKADRTGVFAVQKKERNAARRKRLAGSPSERIRNATSARIWASLKGRSDGALFSRLRYSAAELVSHLEARFLPGMTWQNYGKWHVDHIRPCASFDMTDEKDFIECWALENLQPLWAKDNLAKGARYGAS